MPESDTLSLIDKIYDAACEPAAWPLVMDEVARRFNGMGTSMLDITTPGPSIGVSESLGEADAVYRAGWWRHDSILLAGRRLGLGPGVHVADDFLSKEFRAKDPFYQEFLRPIGSAGSMCLVTAPFNGTLISINVQRRLDAPPVTPKERAGYAQLGRHLSRALGMRFRLATSEAVGCELARRLDHFDCAVAVVSRDGTLVLFNAAFDALRSEGIGVRSGRVLLAQPKSQAALMGLIWSALDGSLGGSGPDTLAVPRPQSLLPLLIRAVPVTPERAERQFGAIPSRAVILMVLNPSHAAYPKLTTALQALGLTSAQARVALAVGSGQSPRETAEQLRISEATVRTTIKHIYAKLGIDRQSRLARLVARAHPFSA